MIACENLTVQVGDFRLEQITFCVPAGAYGVLMGPTGCGKSTLLETICGLRRPESGAVKLDGTEVTNTRIGVRGIGYVPQDGAIFSRMTVRENLAFALRLQNKSRQQVELQTDELAERLRIAHLLPRKATRLSGGEAQRVALGRALASQPRVLLLDEPLSALDDESHREMVQLLKQVHAESGVTVLHVTHSLQDAVNLASTRLQFRAGAIESLATREASPGGSAASSSSDEQPRSTICEQPTGSASDFK